LLASSTTQTHPPSLGEALVNLLLGLLFALIGGCGVVAVIFGTGAACISQPTDCLQHVPGALLAAAIMAPIALVGLNMIVQGLRRQPGMHGFFYVNARRLGRRFSPFQIWLTVFTLSFLIEAAACVVGPGSKSVFYFTFTSSLTLVLIHIVFHELGHFVAARVTGFEPDQVVVGPVAAHLASKQATFSANRDWRFIIGGVVRWTASAPPLPKEQFFVAAAGPMATALLVLLGFLVDSALSPGGALSSMLQNNLEIGLGTLAINLIPLRLSATGLATDGCLMLEASMSMRR
jgi:hypothetical protein